MAARDAKGEKSPRWYVRLIQMAYDSSFKIYLRTTQARDLTPRSNLMDEYQDRVSAVVWDRKMMRTHATHRVGLVSYEARVGDMICVLYGCSVPVILRPWQEKTKSGYQIIGECYVEGIMDGQTMIERCSSGETVSSEDFDIY